MAVITDLAERPDAVPNMAEYNGYKENVAKVYGGTSVSLTMTGSAVAGVMPDWARAVIVTNETDAVAYIRTDGVAAVATADLPIPASQQLPVFLESKNVSVIGSGTGAVRVTPASGMP